MHIFSLHPEFWHRQSGGMPLFPQLEWSKPENKQLAGKLLIIGGNLHGFATPAEAYTESVRAGVGTSRVLLPDALKKILGRTHLDHAEFAPSTPSGSFAKQALATWQDNCTWADGILVPGDLGRNSETAILLEKYLMACEAPTTLTKDAVNYTYTMPHVALERPNTTLVLSLSQLQHLGVAAHFERPIAFSMDLLRLVEWLHTFTCQFAAHIIVKHLDTICVAVHGEVSTTRLARPLDVWRLKTAALASVWWLQHQSKPFEAMTTAVYTLNAQLAA